MKTPCSEKERRGDVGGEADEPPLLKESFLHLHCIYPAFSGRTYLNHANAYDSSPLPRSVSAALMSHLQRGSYVTIIFWKTINLVFALRFAQVPDPAERCVGCRVQYTKVQAKARKKKTKKSGGTTRRVQ